MRMEQHIKNVILSKADDSSVDARFITTEKLFAKKPALKMRE